MKVPAGYKTSEAGVIPEDWDAVPLGSLVTFKNGLNKAKKFFGHGTPIINYMDVFRYPALRMTKVAGRVEVNKAELDSYSVRQGDVFFTRTSETVEEVGIASTMLDVAENTVFSGFVLRARSKRDDLVDQFKVYAFRSEPVRNQITAKATYTTRALTNGGTLSAIYLAKPTKPEQFAIAEALSDMDEAIAAQEAVIAKKRALKTATMQALLSGTRRLPGFSGERERTIIGLLGSTYGGLTGKVKSDFGSGNSKYVTFMNVMTNVVIDCTTFERVRVAVGESQNRVRRGDLIFNGSSETSEDVALCSLMSSEAFDLYLNSFCFGFRLFGDDDVDGLFLTYYLRAKPGRELMKSLAQGSTRYNISKKAFLSASVELPPKEEQMAISKVLMDLDDDLHTSAMLLSKLLSLKLGMMQQLLTGKIRLA